MAFLRKKKKEVIEARGQGASHIIPEVLYPAWSGLLTENTAHTFTDSSANAHVVKALRGVYHTGSLAKVGSTSMRFESANSGTEINVTGHADFAFGQTPSGNSYDFCVEGWYNFISFNSGGTGLWGYTNTDTNDATDGQLQLYLEGTPTTLTLRRNLGAGSVNIQWSWSPVINTWYHIAIVRYGTSLKLYVNGTATSTDHNVSGVDLGRAASGSAFELGTDAYSGRFLQGHIDEFRLVATEAVYTGNFTAPTALTTSGGTYASGTNVNTSITSSKTKLLIHSATTGVHSGAYGTTQSDGFKYYYTDIKGSKPIKDPRIGAHFGSQRHKFSSTQILEQETATNGTNVYSVDGRDWCRFVDSGSNNFEWSNVTHGNYLYAGGSTKPDFTSYVEFTGYFNAVNLHSINRTDSQVNLSIDGVITSDFTGGVSTINSPLMSRYVIAGSVIPLVFSSTPSLGIHTVRIGTDAASKSLRTYGIELIAQDTTSTATKSLIQIPEQKVISFGKQRTITGQQHYDPFNGFVNSTSLHSAFVDTGTSLGLSTAPGSSAAWAISGSNNIRPYNGGRVVKWVGRDGAINTSVNMMPPNAQNISSYASGEITTPSATFGYLPDFSDDPVDHSLSEVARTFHWREFGNGGANGGSATPAFADCTSLHTTSDDIAFVMDDGLTALSGNDVRAASDQDLRPEDVDDYWFLTFIGTGISIKTRTYAPGMYHIAQSLPYGTHVLKAVRDDNTTPDYTLDGIAINDVTGATYASAHEITFHQPKMPPIPEDAVVLADYMLMADFVPITTVDAAGKIPSKGCRRVNASRDFFYDDDGSNSLIFQHFHSDTNAHVVDCEPVGSGETVYAELPSFCTNFVCYAYQVRTRHKIYLDTVNKPHGSGATQDDTASWGSFEHLTTDTTLGHHMLRLEDNTAYFNMGDIDLAIPIHTSHHYQLFETPFTKDLIGGDRNIEQTNLVVTPDGKTWDEVTRNTSYLGGFRWRAGMGGNSGWNVTDRLRFDDQRGAYHNSKLNLGIKDFAWAYDRLVCLVDGEYQLNLTDVYWNYDHPKHLAININGSQAWRTGGYGTERETGTVSFLAHLKRHDYITFYGTLANWTSQDTTPISHWNIVRV